MNNDQAQRHDDGLPDDFEMGPLTDQEKQMAQYELEQKMLDALQDGPSTGHYEPTAEELEEQEMIRRAERKPEADDYREDDPADVVEAPPSQEEIDQMAEESAILRAERREQDSRAPRAVPGSYDQPFKCEDDLPANVFCVIQERMGGRVNHTAQMIDDINRQRTGTGYTLITIHDPIPKSPYFLLWLVSTHLRPASGWYVY